jgi:uncharacterized protein (DUF1499 family)
MGRIMTVLMICLAVVMVVLGYIRLAPSDPNVWHKLPAFESDKQFKAGVMRVVPSGPDGLARLDRIIQAAPRVKLLAGSVDQGMITYVARSKVIGFPDYVTVKQDGDRLKIYSRLRFGRSDLGVNAKRLQGWLNAL